MYINTYIYIHAFSHIYIACRHAFTILNIKINNTGKLHEESILLNCNATALASAASYGMLFSIRTIHVVYQAITEIAAILRDPCQRTEYSTFNSLACNY